MSTAPAGRANRVDDFADARIDRFDGTNRCAESRVPDHVRVREIDEDEIVLPADDGVAHGIGDAGGGHLGLEVVGRHFLGRREHLAIFPFEGFLATAVEEVRHVRILLGLGAAKLLVSRPGDDLREDVRKDVFRKGDRQIEFAVVLGHARVAARERSAGPAGELVEVGDGERAGELARSIGPEVEMKAGVFRLDAVVVADGERFDELVGLAGGVAGVDALARRGGPGALRLDDGAVGALHAFPAIVPIHGPVAPGDGADASRAAGELGLELGQVPGRRARLHVAAVEKRVDDDGHAGTLRHVDQPEQVHERRVDAAVAHEAEEVQAAMRLLRLGHDVDDHAVPGEGAGVNLVVDLRDVHHRDAAGAQIHVPNLAVAHLARGQAHVGAARSDDAAGVAREDRGERRCRARGGSHCRRSLPARRSRRAR